MPATHITVRTAIPEVMQGLHIMAGVTVVGAMTAAGSMAAGMEEVGMAAGATVVEAGATDVS